MELAMGRVDQLERVWMKEMLDKTKDVDYFAIPWRLANGPSIHHESSLRADRLWYATWKKWINNHCPEVDWQV